MEPFFKSGTHQTLPGGINHLVMELVFPRGGRGRQPSTDMLPSHTTKPDPCTAGSLAVIWPGASLLSRK